MEEHFTMTSTTAATGVDTVVSAVVEAWNRHDMKAYSAQFTEDADFVNVVGMHFADAPGSKPCTSICTAPSSRIRICAPRAPPSAP
jgi:hypothetical protein